MDFPLLMQYVVIALAAMISLWVVANKQFPNAVRRLRNMVALRLIREVRPTWIRALGRRIAPAPSASSGTCGGCNNCEPSTRISRKS